MTRSGLPATWLASHAHAAVTLRRHARRSDSEMIVSRVLEHDGDRIPETLADWAEAVALYVAAISGPQPDLTLTFRNINDMDEELPPEAFATDDQGRAVVWASQTIVAAARGDLATVSAFAAVAEGAAGGRPGVLERAELYADALLHGAAPVAAVALDSAAFADMAKQLEQGAAPTYRATCLERSCRYTTTRPYREDRELLAAEHVLDRGHVVKLETVWT